MDKALQLLTLYKQLIEAPDTSRIGFLLVNETRRLFSYDQALLIHGDAFRAAAQRLILHVSGNSAVDERGPFALWLARVLELHSLRSLTSEARVLTRDDMPEPLQSGWDEWIKGSVLLCPLTDSKNRLLAALWLQRASPFEPPETVIAQELCSAAGHIWGRMGRSDSTILSGLRLRTKKLKYAALAAALVFMLWPVRLSVTAPAEIVARAPYVITAPADGLLSDILVTPGQRVEAGDTLALMDQKALGAQAEGARQALEIAEASLARASRESLAAPEKKIELQALRADIESRRIDYDYANALLQNAAIKSPAAGVAIFSDAHTIEGQPVRTGDQIMLVADPADQQLLVRIPADSLIALDTKQQASFRLNIAPLNTHSAKIETQGYQASPDADGLLTYKVRAALEPDEAFRIGLKGTAKLYGTRTVMAYAVLRRPLVMLRRFTGL